MKVDLLFQQPPAPEAVRAPSPPQLPLVYPVRHVRVPPASPPLLTVRVLDPVLLVVVPQLPSVRVLLPHSLPQYTSIEYSACRLRDNQVVSACWHSVG